MKKGHMKMQVFMCPDFISCGQNYLAAFFSLQSISPLELKIL